jgi:hypothetical protein
MTSAFAQQLAALEPDGDRPGRYRAAIAGDWNCPLLPQGGVVAAMAADAMRRELDAPDQPLRSFTTLFVQPVPAGPVTVDVGVVRRGRSMSQATATVRAAAPTPGQTAVAVFGRSRPGFAFTDSVMPDVPPPDDCLSVREPFPDGYVRPEIEFWNHIDSRIALGHLPWDDYVPTTSEMALWYRFDEPPRDPATGVLDPLALVALSDTMLPAVGERLGPGAPEWWGRAPISRSTCWASHGPSGCWPTCASAAQPTATPRPRSRCGTPTPASSPTARRSCSSSSPTGRRPSSRSSRLS